MTHGSTVTYKRHSFRYFPPIAPVAAVSACISARAVASCNVSTRLCPRPTTRSPATTTAPIGTSSLFNACRASFIAMRMNFSSRCCCAALSLIDPFIVLRLRQGRAAAARCCKMVAIYDFTPCRIPGRCTRPTVGAFVAEPRLQIPLPPWRGLRTRSASVVGLWRSGGVKWDMVTYKILPALPFFV